MQFSRLKMRGATRGILGEGNGLSTQNWGKEKPDQSKKRQRKKKKLQDDCSNVWREGARKRSKDQAENGEGTRQWGEGHPDVSGGPGD